MSLFNTTKNFVKSKVNGIVGKVGGGKSQRNLPNSLIIDSNLKGFFGNSKTVQKTWTYLLSFEGLPDSVNNTILPYHIIKCTLPMNNGWKVEQIKLGPYAYGVPVMDFNGYNINITLEEDDQGTIAYLIENLQELIMDNDNPFYNGNYASQTQNRISSINVDIYDDFGDRVLGVSYKDAFYVDSTPIQLDYDSKDTLRYDITFHSSFIEKTFDKFDS